MVVLNMMVSERRDGSAQWRDVVEVLSWCVLREDGSAQCCV